jgi:putative cardiolipin synthase
VIQFLGNSLAHLQHHVRPVVLRRHLLRASACMVGAASLLVLGACATRPPASDYQNHVSSALPASTATPLQRAVAPLAQAHPGESGFQVLSNGTDALRARLVLAASATKTLDMQYYIADVDNTGKLLFEAALRAADRGVRVRMLVDDLNFKDIDDIMGVLDANPHIEVRVFNPFATADENVLQKIGGTVTQLNHLTRRMHNKSMIADNQIAIAGGRNVGDEYFDASTTLTFRDLDVLSVGPIAQPLSDSFDRFWNSEQAYPLRSLNRQHFDQAKLDKVRDDLRQHWRDQAVALGAEPDDQHSMAARLGRGEIPLTWAPAELKVDTPRKINAPTDDYTSPPLQRLAELAAQAQQEFLIISPYFVPHDAGVKMLAGLSQRGVRVALLTNSLAATDAVAVQAGYAPYRIPMLRAGIEVYEFKPVQGRRLSSGLTGSKSKASLHAKAYVIDRKILVIGSMNLDRRSASLNTELALFIDSPELAGQVADLFERGIAPRASYHVTLNSPASMAQWKAAGMLSSPLRWQTEEDGHQVTYDFDPDAGLERNLVTGLFLILPLDNQL